MKYKAKHFYGRVALIACVAVSSAAAVGQSTGRQEPSDPGAMVAPTRYDSFLPERSIAPRDRSPADNWKEANRAVGSIDAMSLTMTHAEGAGAMKAEQPSPAAATQSGSHAGHTMPSTPASDPHAAHQMPPKDKSQVQMNAARKAPDPRAGHKANKPLDAHASHVKPAPDVPDPHAGHAMPPAVPDPHAGHTLMEKK